MFDYTLRVRDLVHGIIRFTKDEQQIIDHPFFQRLRNVKQNGITSFVYPSMNTTRFEHLLGTCHVAGKIAEHITTTEKWREPEYRESLREKTGIITREQFVQLVRVYALLHDLGHLPLSHLFEFALEEHGETEGRNKEETAEYWSGIKGGEYTKVHEAIGAKIVMEYATEVFPDREMSPGEIAVRDAAITLMTKKGIPPEHPLSVVKKIVDSDIDADRIDFVARDGLIAGGEYGHHDIDRLATAIFLEGSEKDGWKLAYSESAIHAMEALLFDRYRIYSWIAYHHRTIAINLLVRFLIVKMLERGKVTKKDFSVMDMRSFSGKDDSWLWVKMREFYPRDSFIRMAHDAVFQRSKDALHRLWKTRPQYRDLVMKEFKTKAGLGRIKKEEVHALIEESRDYVERVSKKAGITGLIFDVSGFRPLENRAITLYSERRKTLLQTHLEEESELVRGLQKIREGDAQFHILFLGKMEQMAKKAEQEEWLKNAWLEAMVRHFRK